MDINKNNKKEQDSELNQLEQNQGKRNHKTKQIVSSEIISTEEVLKPTDKLFKNIHSLPAEEQQFEKKD